MAKSNFRFPTWLLRTSLTIWRFKPTRLLIFFLVLVHLLRCVLIIFITTSFRSVITKYIFFNLGGSVHRALLRRDLDPIVGRGWDPWQCCCCHCSQVLIITRCNKDILTRKETFLYAYFQPPIYLPREHPQISDNLEQQS